MTLSQQAREALARAVAAGHLPGAVALVGEHRAAGAPCAATPAEATPVAFGVRRFGGPEVTPDTRYDLASLTKVVATLPAVLRLASDGELGLDDRMGRFFSNAGWMRQPSLADATVRQLLAHTSGLPAWQPLFAVTSDRLTALAAVLQSPLERPGTVVYSDLGFMLLGAVVERVASQRLDRFVREQLFAPLGMTATGFRRTDEGPEGTPAGLSGAAGAAAGAESPPGPETPAVAGSFAGAEKPAGAETPAGPEVPVAATEACGWRGRLLEGEVHDENAFAWGGVAGHAGLFGTAADLGRYARAWLDRDPLLGSEELLAEAVREQARAEDGAPRGLGWQLAWPGGFAGSASGFGHTGFTGTSLWIDPEAGRYAVLLTNRVHPDRNRFQDMHELRREFHRAAWEGA